MTGVQTCALPISSLIIGEVIFGRPNIPRNILAVVLGSIIYRTIIAFVMARGMSPNDLKLISAAIVVLAISYPAILQKVRVRKLMKEAKLDA